MTASNVIKTAFDTAVITLTDGSGTPKVLTIRFDDGNFSLSGLQSVARETVAIQTRGKLRSLRCGAVVFPTLTFSAKFCEIAESSAGTIFDWLAKRTPFASRVSTTTSIGDVDTCDVTFTMEGTDLGDAVDHVIVCEDVHLMLDFAEGNEGDTLSFSGTVYGDITSTDDIVSVPRGS